MVGWLLARGHRKLRGVCVRASSSPSRPSIQPSRLYEGTPPHATSCCIPSRKSGPTLNGCTRRPDCRNVCISPTAIVVLPTPELVPATTMVGTLAVGSAVPTRMTVEIGEAGRRPSARRAPTERAEVSISRGSPRHRDGLPIEGKDKVIHILETEY